MKKSSVILAIIAGISLILMFISAHNEQSIITRAGMYGFIVCTYAILVSEMVTLLRNIKN